MLSNPKRPPRTKIYHLAGALYEITRYLSLEDDKWTSTVAPTFIKKEVFGGPIFKTIF